MKLNMREDKNLYTSKANQKFLTFFGSDVKEIGTALLNDAFSKGYSLLALDVSAIGIAVEAKVPYTLIDDWIDTATMLHVRENAAKCENMWFEASREMFTLNDICFPEFDKEAIKFFWIEVMLGMALVKAFRAHDVQEVRFFRSNSMRPLVDYFPSDVFSHLLETELPGVAKSYELPRNLAPESRKAQAVFPDIAKSYNLPLLKPFRYILRCIRKVVGKVIRIGRKISIAESSAITDFSALSGKVVLAFNPGESHRFTPIIWQLRDSLPENIAALIVFHDKVTADRIADEWSIPVFSISPSVIDTGMQQQFLRAYEHAIETSSGQPWEKPLKHMRFHFEYYCTQRWPKLASNFRFYQELWQAAPPKAVIVSSLQDSESQLPAEAAKRLDIPSFSIPHGAVMRVDPGGVKSDYILYNLQTQRYLYESVGVPADGLKACRDVVVDNEYPVVSAEVEITHKKCRMLAITNPIGNPGILGLMSIRAQLTALRALNNPPPDIAEQLSLKFKVHPNLIWSDLELFDVIGDGITKNVLPINSELSSVLEQANLIIMVNYRGSVLINALRANKPVVFFWTEPLMTKVESTCNNDLFLQAGVLVHDPEELWNVVRSFVTNPDMAEQMHLKAVKFHKEYLFDENYPSISQVISEISKKNVRCEN